MAVTNPMTVQSRCDSRAIGNARSETRVGTPAIVVRDPVRKNAAEMTSLNRIIQSRHSRRIVPIRRSQKAWLAANAPVS